MPAASTDLTDFLASLAGRRSPRTITGYGRDLAACSAWCAQTLGRPLTAATLTQPLADEYAAHLQRAYRAATINRYLAALLAFDAWGRAAGRRAGLPLQVRWQKRAPAGPQGPDKKAQFKLLAEADRQVQAASVGTPAARRQALRDRAVLYLLLDACLRLSEIVQLRHGDLTLPQRGPATVVVHGKGNKERLVPLSARCKMALAAWLAERGLGAGADYVFTGKREARLGPRGIQRRLAALAQRAGVTVSPHRLRHAGARNLIAAGVPLPEVSQLLGHSSLAVTGVYTVPTHDDVAQGVARTYGE